VRYTIPHWLRYRQNGTVASPATVPSSLDGTVAGKAAGYGAVNTILISLSVTRLVLTPTPNPKRPTKPKFHHEMARTF